MAEFEVMGTQEKTETPTNVNLALNKNVVVSAESVSYTHLDVYKRQPVTLYV